MPIIEGFILRSNTHICLSLKLFLYEVTVQPLDSFVLKTPMVSKIENNIVFALLSIAYCNLFSQSASYQSSVLGEKASMTLRLIVLLHFSLSLFLNQHFKCEIIYLEKSLITQADKNILW